MNKNILYPFSNLPIFVETTEDDEEIMRPLTVEDEMRLFYEKKYERKLKESLEQAFEQARTEGEASGRAAEKLEIARAMKAGNMPVGKIIKCTGLSREEIDKL